MKLLVGKLVVSLQPVDHFGQLSSSDCSVFRSLDDCFLFQGTHCRGPRLISLGKRSSKHG